MPSTRRPVLAWAAALSAATLVLTACGSDDPTADSGAAAPASSSPVGTAAASTAGFPLTIENCGKEITIDKPPQRVVLLKSSSVPYLHELGVMGNVISRAGAYARDYYDDATWAELEKVPLLTDKLDSSGHLLISKETVLDLEPDLVLGVTDNLNHDTLTAVGIPVLEEPALCPDPPGDPGFDDVYDQLTAYGKVFGKPEIAAERVAALRTQVEEVTTSVAGQATSRTAAVLYPTVGGGTTYAYGTRSMADPQLKAAGFTNVFGDADERVFEVTLEELIGRDPDVLILLYSDGEPAKVEEAVADLPGADKLRAVRDGNVMTQLFNFTEPPTPLALIGLERIVDRFGDTQ